MKAAASVSVLLATLLFLPVAHAKPPAAPLRYQPTLDLPLMLGAGTIWASSELLKPHLAPENCRWCEPGELDRNAREALLWSNPARADLLSNLSAYGLVPILTLGLSGVAAIDQNHAGNWPTDAATLAEGVAIAGLLNQMVKFAVGRERPFVHALPESAKTETADPWDNNVSFYSGHTSFTFSLAVGAGTVCSLRGYRAAPLVWATGLTAALLTGYLRIAADRHYLTDVLVGALMGALIGFGVPYLLHRPLPDAVPASTPLPASGSALFSTAWAF